LLIFVEWHLFCSTAYIYFVQEASERMTLFTADEEVFAFQRTVSRLTEMQTEQYWISGDRSQK